MCPMHVHYLFWEKQSFCEKDFLLQSLPCSTCYNECAPWPKSRHQCKQNPGNICIHLLTNLNTAVHYKLGDFQFLVYVWGRCFNFFSFKPVGLFSAFSVLKVDLCLPFYRRNRCYFCCKTRIPKCPCFLLRIFLSFHLTGCPCAMGPIALLGSVLKRMY